MHTPEKITEIGERVAELQDDLTLRNEHENDLIQVGKNKYEERKDAGALLVQVVKSGEYVGKTVGYMKGFAIVPQMKDSEGLNLKLVGTGSYTVHISDSDVGTISRMENCLNGFEKQIEYYTDKRRAYELDLSAAREQVDQPFEQAEEAEQLRNELAAIDAELDLGKQETLLDEDTSEKPIVEIIDEDDDEDEAEVA